MNERPSARLFVLDQDCRVLLFEVDDKGMFADPDRPHSSHYWILPGGGVEEGETYEVAAARELLEETGIGAAIGPCVATQDVILLVRGVPTRILERFYVVRVNEPRVDVDGLFGVEREFFLGHRWWTADEMSRSGELFMPPGLIALATTLASGDVPAEPVRLDR